MREDGDKLGPLALRIMAASHVADLRNTADETGALVRELLELPNLTDRDLTAREVWLALLLRQSR